MVCMKGIQIMMKLVGHFKFFGLIFRRQFVAQGVQSYPGAKINAVTLTSSRISQLDAVCLTECFLLTY